jgi:hypothetical protein
LLVCAAVAAPTLAQQARPVTTQDPRPSMFKTPDFRTLVPGVERPVNPERSFLELSSRHNVEELLKVDGTFDWAKDAHYFHDIWSLEFTFKPVRILAVDLPARGGKLTKKNIWYMVYRVRNPGVVWHTEPTVYADPVRKIEPAAGEFVYAAKGRDELTPGKHEIVEELKDKPVRFTPVFVLFSRDPEIGKQYLDRPLPIAAKMIQQREDPARLLKTTAEMTGDIPAAPEGQDRSVWGVVTWEDVDPRTDYFSIYVQGLTNAFQRKWIPEKNGWWYTQKTLRLDFQRMGDEFSENENEIRFLKKTWVYLDSNLAPAWDSADAAAPVVIAK